jgi:hypothetical protein
MRHVLLTLMLAAACSGPTPPAATPQNSSSQLDLDDLDGDEPGSADRSQGAAAADKAKAEPPPKPAVTFKLVNRAGEDLVFSTDKGWQPVIFAFSGKPPNAKSILMFPTSCTAACDAAEACPVCAPPETGRGTKVNENREVVAPAGALEVPWDGQIHVYEKVAGKKGCECYRKETPPPATYTVRACGLRITRSAKSSSKMQCTDTTMTLPADEPQVVELTFP